MTGRRADKTRSHRNRQKVNLKFTNQRKREDCPDAYIAARVTPTTDPSGADAFQYVVLLHSNLASFALR